MIFNYEAAAKRAGISKDELEKLCVLFRTDFPGDEMMVELHVLRAISSIERGDTTLDEILSQPIVG